MANDIGGVWRTVGGRRIFIKDGEDLETAMKKSGKFGNKKEYEIEGIGKVDEEYLKKEFEKYHKDDWNSYEEWKKEMLADPRSALTRTKKETKSLSRSEMMDIVDRWSEKGFREQEKG